MKRKFLFIPTILLTLILSACDFSKVFSVRVTSLKISDAHGDYLIGQTFATDSKLTINATYNDGTTKQLDYAKDELGTTIFYVDDKGNETTFDYKKPFTQEGNYKVTLSKGAAISNVLDFRVIENHVYASSISLSGDSEVATWNTVSLTVTVNPSNYTTAITYTASNPNSVLLTKTATGVDVYAQKAGEVDIIATTNSSETTTIQASHHLTITGSSSVVQMKHTYNDLVKHAPYRISGCPVKGEPRLLVIPTWLTDSHKYIATSLRDGVKEDISKAYFGTSQDTGWYSVSSYYETESQGKLKLKGTVSDWYECGNSTSQIGANDFSTNGLVKKAVDWYFNNNPTDLRSNYDYDGDGYLDGVIIIYAAPDKTHSGLESYDNLWAYCYWIQEAVRPGIPTANAYFWASYDFLYGETTVRKATGTNYFGGDTRFATIDAHTYTHEMGHMFGLKDYYDYSKSYIPAGGFSMQDYNVGGHDPYSLLSLGWVDTYLPTDSMTLKIRSFSEGYDLILLTPEFNSAFSPFDEYLLIEFFTPTGTNELDSRYPYMGYYKQGANKAGIRLWHVDARLARHTGSSVVLTTSDTNQSSIECGMSNTYNLNKVDKDYLSVLGEGNYEYNLNQLIRNSKTETHHNENWVTESDLFYEGDSFDMNTFGKQFVNTGKLNNKKDLGWSFVVDKIVVNSESSYAQITLTKNA